MQQEKAEANESDNAASSGGQAAVGGVLRPGGTVPRSGFYKLSCALRRKHLRRSTTFPSCPHDDPRHYWRLVSDTNGPKFVDPDDAPVDS
ncbi:hypothetical protein Ade02nite_14830 [Paractinoplanes deccanensis]|uniref:Uncharacterized protein n=1 Tax=Paractinoplanes deccanensis TaxID=113561 RepID=A0ABQ3XYM7_9ACTN|nr:hypothetical protein [Actinoplanes deccanensis]GID72842.1 hypothetical protein Ade02nite_14830 [Actinoplanes deccanensis]